MNVSTISNARDAVRPGRQHRSDHAAAGLIVGIAGVRRNAAVAACANGALTAFCEQERVTRVRGIKLDPTVVPEQALAAVLALAGRRSSDIERYAVAEEEVRLPGDLHVERIDHHEAHAACAFYSSVFERAAVLVCDRHNVPPMSVWAAGPSGLQRHQWDGGVGLAFLYSECARIFGFDEGQEHRLEALARLDRGDEAERLGQVWSYSSGAVRAHDTWRSAVAEWLDERRDLRHRARVAAACQCRLGQLLLELVRDVRAAVDVPTLCLSGGLFYNTYFTTLLRQAPGVDDLFVAPNPGNAGVAAGAAFAASPSTLPRHVVSPFLGPEFDVEETKATLDNCKLSYECLSEGDTIAAAVDALRRGHLVGWFQGRMEWGARALGNRSILADPRRADMREIINTKIKFREKFRPFAPAVLEERHHEFFEGSVADPFMLQVYPVRPDKRDVIPAVTHVDGSGRLQTVARDANPRYWQLIRAFGDRTGVPVLLNTSFNVKGEPIVETPEDAIQCFLTTGIDYLVLHDVLMEKKRAHTVVSPVIAAYSELASLIRTALTADVRD
jgi:carbamoyltransferase